MLRAAVGNAGLDDQVWFDLPDEFLHRHHVLRILDDGAALPLKMVGIIEGIRLIKPMSSRIGELPITSLSSDLLGTFCLKLIISRHGYALF